MLQQAGVRRIPRAVILEAWFFVAALVAAFFLFDAGIIEAVMSQVTALGPLLGGFIAGAAYSTFVTTPFALAGFVEMGQSIQTPAWQIAVTGALGASVVDLMLVKSIRSPLSLHIVRSIFGNDTEPIKRRLQRSSLMRWIAVLVGGLLIAFPLPTDELGIIFFGASGLSTTRMFPVIMAADFFGIYSIVSMANLIS